MKNKGMEMPIQIFITLFVLLAVAMLVLQMVSTQFSTQTTEMEKQQRAQKLQAQKNRMKDICSSLCKEANRVDDLRSKAAFCKYSFTEGLDLTMNGLTTDYDESELVGIGLCEDRIYCPLIYTCDVGGLTLNMQNCKNILCAFWQSQGFSPQKQKDLLMEFIQPGSCYHSLTNKANHWYTILYDTDGSGTVDTNSEVKC